MANFVPFHMLGSEMNDDQKKAYQTLSGTPVDPNGVYFAGSFPNTGNNNTLRLAEAMGEVALEDAPMIVQALSSHNFWNEFTVAMQLMAQINAKLNSIQLPG